MSVHGEQVVYHVSSVNGMEFALWSYLSAMAGLDYRILNLQLDRSEDHVSGHLLSLQISPEERTTILCSIALTFSMCSIVGINYTMALHPVLYMSAQCTLCGFVPCLRPGDACNNIGKGAVQYFQCELM